MEYALTFQENHKDRNEMNAFIRNLKEYRLNSILVRIFLSIITLILIATGLVAFFSYRKSSRMMTHEVQNSNMLVLTQSQKGIDQKINTLKANIMQAALNRSLNKVLYLTSENSYSDFESIQDSISYLSALQSNNDTISDIWLYSQKSNIVIGPAGKYQRSLFFSEVCNYMETLDWEQIFTASGFHYISRATTLRGTTQIPVIVFSQSLPCLDRSPKGMLIVNLSESLFEEEMSGYTEEKVVFNYVVDDSEKIIYTNESLYPEFEDLDLIQSAIHEQLPAMQDAHDTLELVIEGKPFTIQYVRSNALDWIYVSVIPTKYIQENANQIKKVTLLVVVASIILTAVLTLYIVNGLYRPISRILSYIHIIGEKKGVTAQNTNSNEFALINGMLDYIYKENQTLQDNFEKSRPMLQEKYIYDLINGQIMADYETVGLEIGISLSYPCYQIIILEIGKGTPSGLKKYRKSRKETIAQLKEIARQTLGEHCNCYFLEKNDQTIVSLINAPKSFYECDGINDYLNKIQEYLLQKEELPYVIGVGQSYPDIQNCYRSYIDALETIKYQIVKGQNSVIYIDEVKNSSSAAITYPLEKEAQLIMITKSGNQEAALAALEQVFRENLMEQELSPEMIDNLFDALAGTAIRTIFEMRLTNMQIFPENHDIYKELNKRNSIDEKKTYITDVFRKISQFASDNKYRQQSRILEKINLYLEENYSKDISLDTVAEVVNLSASYLSFIFKESSGLNFVDYVNQFRLQKAKELLCNTSYNIAQVAELVGYNSANSFSKVFKKYNGISPGQYRKL